MKTNKKFIKKIIAIMLVLSMLWLSACGATKDVSQEPKESETIEETKKPVVEEPVEPAEPEIDLNRDVIGDVGVVASAKPEASEVGIEIMKKGGNAIDAAVATSFALGVVEPNASGIGGGGFMMIRFAETGEEVFLDFREVGPEKSEPDMYKMDDKGRVIGNVKKEGELSVAVPGEVDGLLLALDKYGSMDRKDVIQPAIDLAENGFVVTKNFANMIADTYDKINRFPATADIYLKEGLPYEEGDILKNPDLANTLRIIAEEGRDGFYKGEVAQDIVDTLSNGIAADGIITLEDLANYETKVREPVKGTYRGYEIISSPPSSSGGTHVIQILNMLENYDIQKLGHNTAESLHLWSEVSKRAFKDRSKYMGDTDFVDVPLEGLLSKDYAKKLVENIDFNSITEEIKAGDPTEYESGSTTHISVMDKDGNMVAITKTINHFFGSGVSVAGRGFILNNIMSSFSATPGKINSVAPYKRPLSSMAPTFVLKDGEPIMTLGSPGSTRIIPTVAQIISNVIDHGMDVQEAINAPRMYDNNGKLELEDRIDEDAIKELEKLGHEVEIRGDFDEYFGGAQCIMRLEDGKLHGGADPRRDGKAAGF